LEWIYSWEGPKPHSSARGLLYIVSRIHIYSSRVFFFILVPRRKRDEFFMQLQPSTSAQLSQIEGLFHRWVKKLVCHSSSATMWHFEACISILDLS
jgi:hypothetical protein